MQLSHLSRRRPRADHRWTHPERGYSTVMMAILLVPMMIFAGFAVDVGSFYTRAMEIQRAADAAALAGVVWLPGDPDRANDEARLTAKRNGFDPAVNSNISVQVLPVAGRPQELDVIITDSRVPTFFAAVVKKSITITRSARARYVLPVPLGSPFNFFGNTPGRSLTPQPLLFPHISAPFSNHSDGDPFSTKCAATGATSALGCTGGANADYRPEGYLYIVDVPPEGVGRTLTVEIYDSTWGPECSSGTSGTYCSSDVTRFAGDRWLGSSSGSDRVTRRQPALRYSMYDTDPTPLDPTDNPLRTCNSPSPGVLTLSNTNTSADHTYVTLCQFSVSAAGQYPIRVQSSGITGTTDQGNGSAGYSLIATLNGTGAQPRLFAYSDMSIQTSLVGNANLYLAEVVPDHAGKTFQIELFDPGDGSGSNDYYMSILGPDNAVAQCRYTNSSGAWVGPGNCRIQTRDGSTNAYNDKWLRIEISLPANYNCVRTTVTGCWWKMRYELTGTPTDRTVWRANVLGDPVQLIR